MADYFDSGLKLRSQVDQQFVIACFINIVEIFRASTPVNEFPVVNLFKDIDDVSWYWQIYGSSVEPANLVIHWGKFGEYGEHKEIRNKPIEELREIYNKGLLEKQSEGYTRAEKYQRMILQFPVEGWGDTSDLDFRNEVWECVEPYIHWSVNGYVSGGDIGGGTINIFLGVISPEYAVHVITKVLEQKNIKRPYLIALELDESSGEEGDGFGVKVLYPNDFQGSFSY